VNGNQDLPIQVHDFAEVVEGFYLETTDGLFFAVKGMEHPPDRRIAVLRYVPDPSGGSRKKGNTAYRRMYHFDEQERFIRTACPQYLSYDPVFQTTLQGVPIGQVRTVFDPRKKFREMAEAGARAEIENDAFAFLSRLQTEAGVPPSALGITGSLLIGLYTETSDLDAVVFGTENCYRVYRALQRMLDAAQDGELRRLNAVEMKELFTQRAADTQMNYDDFLALESRKVNQGVFRERTYFVRFVKEAQEIEDAYGRLRYTPLGRSVITASIADDRDRIFTPCRYALSDIRILKGPQLTDLNEIVSFRGRFCEQARTGEAVRASGTLEHIQNSNGGTRHRLLLGNSPEDHMTVSGI